MDPEFGGLVEVPRGTFDRESTGFALVSSRSSARYQALQISLAAICLVECAVLAGLFIKRTWRPRIPKNRDASTVFGSRGEETG
jgi:hypothetical protein